MSTKNKENDEENQCSLETFTDLLDTANQQIRDLERLDFSRIQLDCQQELENWHTAAVAHLEQIYAQRLEDLSHVYSQDVCPEAKKFKEKMTDTIKHRIMPKVSHVLDDQIPDPDKIDRMQVNKQIFIIFFTEFLALERVELY